MDLFSSYTRNWTTNFTWNASCTLGMMQMQPKAVQVPEDPNDLKPYISSEKVFEIGGGLLVSFSGILVEDSILNLPYFDIWKKSMELGGQLKESPWVDQYGNPFT